MKINDDLKIVIPLRTGDNGVEIYAYHSPISREVFEVNYRILAATKAELASKGIHYQMDSGPRIAALVLMDEARKDAFNNGYVDEKGNGIDDNARALREEIKRLTTVLVATNDGWTQSPINAAINAEKIDEEEWREVESAIVFFTCHYALAKKADRKSIGEATASLLRGSSTSLACSEFLASLPPLMKEEVSAKSAGSSVPS